MFTAASQRLKFTNRDKNKQNTSKTLTCKKKKILFGKKKGFKCFLNVSTFVDKVFQADEAAIVNRLSTETKWDLGITSLNVSCAERRFLDWVCTM